MTAKTTKQAYDEIIAHIQEQKGPYSTWYCGIAADWKDRLFNAHNIPKENYWHIACQCFTHSDARAVEKGLLDLGCDGGPGGGDNTTVWVYAYLKGSMTNP